MSAEFPTPSRMVHVRTVPTPFHARVIAARLGSEGIVTELRGNVGDGPYPFGASSVWVEEADAEIAAEILLADEVESAFDDDPTPAGRSLRVGTRRVLAAAGLLLVMAAALAARVGF